MRRWCLALLLAAGPAWAPSWAQSLGGWVADARTGCLIWNPNPVPGETATWLGPCVGHHAEGQGAVIWQRGDRLLERDEGQWHEGRQVGAGVQAWQGGRYEGGVRDGLPHGQGVLLAADGSRFAGRFRDGKPDGPGRLEGPDGTFEGLWQAGCFAADGRRARFGTAAPCP